MKTSRSNLWRLSDVGGVAVLSMLLLSHTWKGGAQSERKKLPEPSVGGLTIDIILDQLEKNITEYRRSVPNLYCIEKATASRTTGGRPSGADFAAPGGSLPSERDRPEEARTKSEALFRLRRTSDSTDKGEFEESRVIQKLDGTRNGSDLSVIAEPAILLGIFSNGLNIFSREGRACFSFKLHPPQESKPIRVDFADLPLSERGVNCPAFEATSGHVLIEQSSMRVIRIDKHVPRHELVSGIFGSWDWTEEYAPVLLLNQKFWMPTKIHSRSLSKDTPQEWTFDAVYSDYHLFHTESHIVP